MMPTATASLVLLLAGCAAALAGGAAPEMSAPAEGAPVTGPTDDWNIDVPVESFPARDSGRLAMDADTNGDIYIGMLGSRSGGPDSVHVWRTTDAGVNWNRVLIAAGNSPSDRIRDFVLRVGHDSLGTVVCCFLVRAGDAGLSLFRFRPPFADTATITIAAGPGIRGVAADRNIESPERLFVAWDTDGDSVFAAASADCGLGWPVNRALLGQHARPALCAGGDGNVYVAARQRDSLWIDVATGRANLSTPEVTYRRLDSSATGRVWNATIAADRAAPDSAQTAIALYCRRDSVARTPIRNGISVNGGRTWTTSIWPPANVQRTTWDIRNPYLRRSYDNSLFRAVATAREPTRNWDTLIYAFTRAASPQVWEQRQWLNNFRASDRIGAVVDFCPPLLGGFLAYVNEMRTALYRDGYGFTGIADDGSVAGDACRAAFLGDELLLSLASPGRVRVTLYDCAGRRAGRGFDGRLAAGRHVLRLAPAGGAAGCYFARVQIGGRSTAAKLVRR